MIKYIFLKVLNAGRSSLIKFEEVTDLLGTYRISSFLLTPKHSSATYIILI